MSVVSNSYTFLQAQQNLLYSKVKVVISLFTHQHLSHNHTKSYDDSILPHRDRDRQTGRQAERKAATTVFTGFALNCNFWHVTC